MSERQSTYSVYLIERRGEQGGKRQVTSPVTGHQLDFYDTGVWLDRATGRNFFPYEQIRTIREHPEGKGPESRGGGRENRGDGRNEDEEGHEAEENPESTPERDRTDETPEEGDPGAEEEMLEE